MEQEPNVEAEPTQAAQAAQASDSTETTKSNKRWTRLIPIAILLLGLGLLMYFRVDRYLNLNWLYEKHALLRTWTENHYLWSVLSFVGIYILAVAFSLPGAVVLTLIGGFLFGPWFGGVYVVIGATIGASLLFLAASTAFKGFFAKRAGSMLDKMSAGFNDNALSYLLVLRLVPIFPFFLVNIVPAFFNVRFRLFFFTTLFGIMPGSFVYTSIGNGLAALIRLNQRPDLGVIFKPEILLPLLGLAALSLIPLIYKRLRKRSEQSTG